MSTFIRISEKDYADGVAMAQETLARFENVPGHYSNTLNSHLRGKLGEIAYSHWLESNELSTEPVYRDVSRMREADIIVNGSRIIRLDVKTWDIKYWVEMGRCVAIGQLDKLRAKADGILWCISPSELGPEIELELVGWNTISEIEQAPQRITGPPGGRQVHNYQIDTDKIKSLSDLLDTLRSGK